MRFQGEDYFAKETQSSIRQISSTFERTWRTSRRLRRVASAVVLMPDRTIFESEDAYYSTLFHELVHSTGHTKRLNRKSLTDSKGFASDPYCHEELVAEMGAAFVCGTAGIAQSYAENSAAYIQHWLAHLKADTKILIHASAQAQKAADFILGYMRTNDSESLNS